ncbi:MAG TPA: RNA-binding protein [Anaerolineae bacterium]
MSKRLFVGNLSYTTTEETVRTVFAEVGPVVSVSLVTDRATGQPRGFGFVEMTTEEAARDAIARLNGREVDQRKITVNEARPQQDRGGGGFRGGGGDRDRGHGRGRDRDRGDRRDRY